MKKVLGKIKKEALQVLPGPKDKLHFVHIGKCGGSTLGQAIRNSPVVKRQFRGVEHVHIRKPVYRPGTCYLIVVRNPIARAISAFNWRFKLVVTTGKQRDRFAGEHATLTKYGTLNNLAEALCTDGAVNPEVEQEFRSIHHLREDIHFYLEPLLGRLDPDQIFGVFAQETLDDDMRAVLGVEPAERLKDNSAAAQTTESDLSPLAIKNLRKVLAADFDALEKLNGTFPLGEDRMDVLRALPVAKGEAAAV